MADPIDQLSDDELEALCEMEFLRGSGPGGQHRNKVESGVRLRHPETGIVVTATERRSQARNRKLAVERMRQALEERERKRKRKKRKKTKPSRAAKERRLEEKKKAGQKKKRRKKVPLPPDS